MSMATTTASSKKRAKGKGDWDSIKLEIMRRVGIRAMFERLGVKFVEGGVPNAKGWQESFALGRDDKKPSAACCVELDGDKPGHYTDLGGNKSCSIWDLTAEVMGLGDYMDAVKYWAEVAGVELPSSPAGRSKTKGKAGKADGEKSGFVTFVPKPQSIGGPFGIWAKTKRWQNYPRADVVALLKGIGCEVGRIWGVDCIAFPVTESGADGETVGRMLYRVDGQDFEYEERREKTRYDQLSGHGFEIVGRDAEGNIVRGSAALAACKVIITPEGPTDLFALMLHSPNGYAVATSSNGASKRGRESNLTAFAGKEVFVIGDADNAGQAGAERAAKSIAADAARVVLVEPLYEVTENHGKDVRDWFEEGRTFEELLAVMQRGRVVDASEATPKRLAGEEAASAPDDEDCGCVSNGMQLGEGGFLAYSMPEIREDIRKRTGDWPRMAGGRLFYVKNGKVKFLGSRSEFFAFIGEKTGKPAKFSQTGAAHTKDEVFSAWKAEATSYDATELLPHFPPLANHYYATPTPEPGDGTTLERLLDFFAPETTLDRDLMKAMFATPLWGSTGGKRPAFVLTSEAGRGAGKTTQAEQVGRLFGGAVSIDSGEKVADLKTRLLSDQALLSRVAILDNVKSNRLSWADFEALLTAPTISGRMLYQGEGSRPNVITYIITLNGIALSRDMAQRSVIIKLAKPTYSGNWRADVEKFIDDNRMKIIGDLIAFLMQEPRELKSFTRWGEWERHILAKLPEPSEAQALIKERQVAADMDLAESSLIEDIFGEKLRELYYDPEVESVFIPTAICAQWYGEAVGERFMSPNRVTSRLKQAIEEGLVSRLRECPSRTHGRGWFWLGGDTEQQRHPNGDLKTRIEESRKRVSV